VQRANVVRLDPDFIAREVSAVSYLGNVVAAVGVLWAVVAAVVAGFGFSHRKSSENRQHSQCKAKNH